MFIGLFTGKLKTGKDQRPSIMSGNKPLAFMAAKGAFPLQSRTTQAIRMGAIYSF